MPVPTEPVPSGHASARGSRGRTSPWSRISYVRIKNYYKCLNQRSTPIFRRNRSGGPHRVLIHTYGYIARGILFRYSRISWFSLELGRVSTQELTGARSVQCRSSYTTSQRVTKTSRTCWEVRVQTWRR